MTWTDEIVNKLRGMAADKKTAREIACELGITTNSVIGKCHREGIQLLGKPWGNTRETHRERRARKMRERPIAELPPFVPLLLPARREEPRQSAGVKIEDLEWHHCRWPLWNDRERPTMMFCGLPTRDDTVSYCGGHCDGDLKRGFPAAFAGRPALRRPSYWR